MSIFVSTVFRLFLLAFCTQITTFEIFLYLLLSVINYSIHSIFIDSVVLSSRRVANTSPQTCFSVCYEN